jgi:superfamily II DNA/RNA helicase
MTTFSQMNLDPSINKAIEICGYTTPTPVQLQTIPKIMNGDDIVACAPTGTGKTAAFVLPALDRLCKQSTVRKPRILVLTPTRELASQITQASIKYGKFMKLNMASLVGGMPYRQQLRDLSRTVDMIVATPGRLLDHMENRRIDLSGIEMLVLDEADRMLDMGFIDDVQAIAKATPSTRQTLLFSATVDGKLGQVVKNLLNNPVRVDLSQDNLSPSQIKQELYLTDNPQHKARLLQHFLDNGNIFKAIIFTATKIGADKLAGQLEDQGYASAALHGDLKQSQRNRTIEQMRRGKIQFLVATDVAARGIDISDMTHVINYDLPRFSEDYVHRIGRTGRAGKTGIAISFALQSDALHVQRIEKYIGAKLDVLMIDGIEPVNKHFNPNPPKKGRGRKPAFGGKPAGGGRSGGRSSFGGGSDRAESGGRGRSSFGGGRPERAESGRGRPSFGGGRPDRAESSRGKSGFGSDRADTGRARPSFGGERAERSESGRSRPSFGSSDRAESGRSKPSFAGGRSSDRAESGGRSRPSFGSSDRTESGRSRPSFAGGRSSDRTESGRGRPSAGGERAPAAGRGRPSFGSSDRGESSGRGRPSFAGDRSERSEGRGRPSFGGSERTESGRGRPSFGAPRGDRAEAGARPSSGRSERSAAPSRARPSFAKSDRADSGRSRPTSAKPAARTKSGFAKDGDSAAKSVKVAYKSKKD